MLLNKSKLAALAAIALSVGPAMTPTANATPPNPVTAQISVDANGDGQVTRDEFLAQRSAKFPELDANASGGLSLKEFSTALTGKVKKHAGMAFSKVDSNGDGEISLAEWDANPPRAFDKADKDKDGVLTSTELSKLSR